MSIHSLVHAFIFKCSLPIEEINEKLKEKGLDGFYRFSRFQMGGEEFYELDLDDYYFSQKETELAEFVSEVIDRDDHAVIEFDGEDGRYGYLVLHGEVQVISYEQYVKGMPLEDYVKERRDHEDLALC